MLRFIPVLLILVFAAACHDKAAPAAKPAAKDPKIVAAEEKIAKTTPEGKSMIEKVLAMKPKVNDQESGKTLKEKADTWAKDNGAYNIAPIGWAAEQKKPIASEKVGRWKIVFHYQTYDKQFLAAEWEYNPETNELYPFEKTNAPGFWDPPAADAKKGKK
jgi:hypothetical protein